MSNDYEFDLRFLYNQQTAIEGDNYVESRVYAISYLYPGAISRISSRCRVTVVYKFDNLSLFVNGGTIEKWTDKGWIVVEEFFETAIDFMEIDEVFDYMTTLYKSFLLGLPIDLRKKHSPVPPPPKPDFKEKNPKLRVLSFKDSIKANNYKNNKSKDQENNKKADDKKDDSPDFDWI